VNDKVTVTRSCCPVTRVIGEASTRLVNPQNAESPQAVLGAIVRLQTAIFVETWSTFPFRWAVMLPARMIVDWKVVADVVSVLNELDAVE
jgi:hypothetical protein